MPVHNPYHFVPTSALRKDDLAVSRFVEGELGHVGHDRYHAQHLSGRLLCRLTLEDPTFVGAKRVRDATERLPAKVEPFTLDGQPAIPATSLRGLLSSVAEAASNSALRVLEDRPYSFRKKMNESLSAIGMVFVESGPDGHLSYQLRPLVLPSIQVRQGAPVELPREFSGLYPIPNLKVFIGSRSVAVGLPAVQSEEFVRKFPTWNMQNCVYFGMKLRSRTWDGRAERLLPDLQQRRKPGQGASEYLLGQRGFSPDPPRPWHEVERLSEPEKSQYVRGIIRTLGVFGRDDMPNTKKHEFFIPYPQEAEAWPTFEIPRDVVRRFYELADQRTEVRKELPFEPKGTSRRLEPEAPIDKDAVAYRSKTNRSDQFWLKTGDLVYFRPEDRNGGTVIGEISLSSIWRGRVEEQTSGPKKKASAYDFFRRINPELLPFDRAVRKQVTLCEQLFGFVEQQERSGVQEAGESDASLALASRLRFSAALPDAASLVNPFLAPVTLKILDSPKPPSPALYFKRRDGNSRAIAKSELQPGAHLPQGRKFYLHRRAGPGAPPWMTAAPDDQCSQKAEVTPMRAGLTFYFHIDFDNLSPRELNLLSFALRPDEPFRHKLGMGKPLGLGRVRIDRLGIFEIDRQKRYTAEGFLGTRYHRGWIVPGENPTNWPEPYASLAKGIVNHKPLDLGEAAHTFAREMDKDVLRALKLIGDPSKIRCDVNTPLVRGQHKEIETYKWFVANDIGSGRGTDRLRPAEKSLPPLNKDSTELPILSDLEWRGD